jgi:small subunit ribosomal protein S4
MGDPRKQRRKYSGPQHPWNRARIDEEKVLVEEYGLKNKKELWKMSSKLAQFKRQAKVLIAQKGEQAEAEKKLFLDKLERLKLINNEATLDDVLDLAVKDLLERRLQTFLYRKGFAKSIKQSRQFIVHEHVFYNGQKMNVPSFLVPITFEQTIEFDPKSALSDPEHPERKIEEKAPEVVSTIGTEEAGPDVLSTEAPKEEIVIEETKEAPVQ